MTGPLLALETESLLNFPQPWGWAEEVWQAETLAPPHLLQASLGHRHRHEVSGVVSWVLGPARCRCAVCREDEVSHLPVQPLHSEALEDGHTWTSPHWGTCTAYSEATGVGKGRGAEKLRQKERNIKV